MTPFNPEGKQHPNYGEIFGPAMEITDPEDAKQYLAAYMKFMREQWDKEGPEEVAKHSRGHTLEEIAKGNLAYYAGYYDTKTRIRVEKLFDCAHPIFGKAEQGTPTPEEAFAMGQTMAKEK